MTVVYTTEVVHFVAGGAATAGVGVSRQVVFVLVRVFVTIVSPRSSKWRLTGSSAALDRMHVVTVVVLFLCIKYRPLTEKNKTYTVWLT
jgi:hypothetical protein